MLPCRWAWRRRMLSVRSTPARASVEGNTHHWMQSNSRAVSTSQSLVHGALPHLAPHARALGFPCRLLWRHIRLTQLHCLAARLLPPLQVQLACCLPAACMLAQTLAPNIACSSPPDSQQQQPASQLPLQPLPSPQPQPAARESGIFICPLCRREMQLIATIEGHKYQGCGKEIVADDWVCP
jgi:hypothetical protein